MCVAKLLEIFWYRTCFSGCKLITWPGRGAELSRVSRHQMCVINGLSRQRKLRKFSKNVLITTRQICVRLVVSPPHHLSCSIQTNNRVAIKVINGWARPRTRRSQTVECLTASGMLRRAAFLLLSQHRSGVSGSTSACSASAGGRGRACLSGS